MAAEKPEAEKPVAVSAAPASLNPLGRAPELFTFLAVPIVVGLWATGESDLRVYFVLIGILIPLSFVGGILTNVQPKIPGSP